MRPEFTINTPIGKVTVEENALINNDSIAILCVANVTGTTGVPIDSPCPAEIERVVAERANLGQRATIVALAPRPYAVLRDCYLSMSAWSLNLAKATDDQLRAECERRKIIGDDDKAALVDDRDALWAQCNDLREANRKAEVDRDEWKRRAEAAEAKLESMRLPPAEALALFERAAEQMRARGSCAICGAPPGARCTPDCDDDRVPDDMVRPHAAVWERARTPEGGPVSLLPEPKPSDDSGHWFDPIDLLADDE